MTSFVNTARNIITQQVICTATTQPPLVVNNTNLVSNLNAQLLNTQPASYYTNAQNINAGSLSTSFGGTGIQTISNGQLFFASNNVFCQSSNLYFNYTSNYLGINNFNPQNSLDVAGNTYIKGNLIVTGNINIIGSNISSNQSATSNSNLSVSAGGTGVSYINQGYLLFGQGTSSIGYSSNLFFNIASNYMGINNGSPQYPLDIVGNTNIKGNLTVSGNITVSGVQSGSSQTTSILSTNQGGTGLSNPNFGQIFYGYNSNPFGQSSNLYWDSTNYRLGIRNLSPQHAIDVVGNIMYSSQAISTISNLPPFIVASTSQVTNLNVSYLAGYSSTYYLSASNITQGGQLGVAYGGTGVSNMTNGYVHFGSNGVLGQTSNLYWNNSTNQLGIGTQNPTQSLDIAIGGLKISSNSPVSTQGGYLQWNRQLQGSTYLMNQRGLGTGGIYFGEVDLANNFTQTMCLLSNGYLGIGTSNPQTLLDVNGSATFRKTDTQISIQNTGASNGYPAEIKFFNQDNSLGWSLGQATFTQAWCNFTIYNNYAQSNAITISSNNRFGIGGNGNTPVAPLTIVNTISFNMGYAYQYLGNTNSSNVGYNSARAQTITDLCVYSYGRILATEVDAYSDQRLKTNIKLLNIQEQYSTIQKLNPVNFSFKSSPNTIQYGFIAQDLIKKDLSQLVCVVPNEDLDEYIDEDNFLSSAKSQLNINYNNFIAIHTKVLQDLCRRIDYIEQILQISQK